jgi:hypothetical protein
MRNTVFTSCTVEHVRDAVGKNRPARQHRRSAVHLRDADVCISAMFCESNILNSSSRGKLLRPFSDTIVVSSSVVGKDDVDGCTGDNGVRDRGS